MDKDPAPETREIEVNPAILVSQRTEARIERFLKDGAHPDENFWIIQFDSEMQPLPPATDYTATLEFVERGLRLIDPGEVAAPSADSQMRRRVLSEKFHTFVESVLFAPERLQAIKRKQARKSSADPARALEEFKTFCDSLGGLREQFHSRLSELAPVTRAFECIIRHLTHGIYAYYQAKTIESALLVDHMPGSGNRRKERASVPRATRIIAHELGLDQSEVEQVHVEAVAANLHRIAAVRLRQEAHAALNPNAAGDFSDLIISGLLPLEGNSNTLEIKQLNMAVETFLSDPAVRRKFSTQARSSRQFTAEDQRIITLIRRRRFEAPPEGATAEEKKGYRLTFDQIKSEIATFDDVSASEVPTQSGALAAHNQRVQRDIDLLDSVVDLSHAIDLWLRVPGMQRKFSVGARRSHLFDANDKKVIAFIKKRCFDPAPAHTTWAEKANHQLPPDEILAELNAAFPEDVSKAYVAPSKSLQAHIDRKQEAEIGTSTLRTVADRVALRSTEREPLDPGFVKNRFKDHDLAAKFSGNNKDTKYVQHERTLTTNILIERGTPTQLSERLAAIEAQAKKYYTAGEEGFPSIPFPGYDQTFQEYVANEYTRLTEALLTQGDTTAILERYRSMVTLARAAHPLSEVINQMLPRLAEQAVDYTETPALVPPAREVLEASLHASDDQIAEGKALSEAETASREREMVLLLEEAVGSEKPEVRRAALAARRAELEELLRQTADPAAKRMLEAELYAIDRKTTRPANFATTEPAYVGRAVRVLEGTTGNKDKPATAIYLEDRIRKESDRLARLQANVPTTDVAAGIEAYAAAIVGGIQSHTEISSDRKQALEKLVKGMANVESTFRDELARAQNPSLAIGGTISLFEDWLSNLVIDVTDPVEVELHAAERARDLINAVFSADHVQAWLDQIGPDDDSPQMTFDQMAEHIAELRNLAIELAQSGGMGTQLALRELEHRIQLLDQRVGWRVKGMPEPDAVPLAAEQTPDAPSEADLLFAQLEGIDLEDESTLADNLRAILPRVRALVSTLRLSSEAAQRNVDRLVEALGQIEQGVFVDATDEVDVVVALQPIIGEIMSDGSVDSSSGMYLVLDWVNQSLCTVTNIGTMLGDLPADEISEPLDNISHRDIVNFVLEKLTDKYSIGLTLTEAELAEIDTIAVPAINRALVLLGEYGMQQDSIDQYEQLLLQAARAEVVHRTLEDPLLHNDRKYLEVLSRRINQFQGDVDLGRMDQEELSEIRSWRDNIQKQENFADPRSYLEAALNAAQNDKIDGWQSVLEEDHGFTIDWDSIMELADHTISRLPESRDLCGEAFYVEALCDARTIKLYDLIAHSKLADISHQSIDIGDFMKKVARDIAVEHTVQELTRTERILWEAWHNLRPLVSDQSAREQILEAKATLTAAGIQHPDQFQSDLDFVQHLLSMRNPSQPLLESSVQWEGPFPQWRGQWELGKKFDYGDPDAGSVYRFVVVGYDSNSRGNGNRIACHAVGRDTNQGVIDNSIRYFDPSELDRDLQSSVIVSAQANGDLNPEFSLWIERATELSKDATGVLESREEYSMRLEIARMRLAKCMETLAFLPSQSFAELGQVWSELHEQVQSSIDHEPNIPLESTVEYLANTVRRMSEIFDMRIPSLTHYSLGDDETLLKEALSLLQEASSRAVSARTGFMLGIRNFIAQTEVEESSELVQVVLEWQQYLDTSAFHSDLSGKVDESEALSDLFAALPAAARMALQAIVVDVNSVYEGGGPRDVGDRFKQCV